MSQPRRPKTPSGKPAPEPKSRPLAGLDKLRSQLRARPPAPPAKPAQAATAEPLAPTEDLAALLRTSLGLVQPMPADGRAEVERPKPPPRPRPKPPQEVEPDLRENGAARRRPQDPFAAAMADVTPLKDSGRVDLSGPGAPGSHQDPEPAPPLPDLHDPIQLFRHATQGTTPLPDQGRLHLERPGPAPRPVKRVEDEESVLKEALSTPLSFEDRLDSGEEAAFLRVGLPRRILTDLRRGRWVVQGELDLHGLTRDEARATLAAFLASSLSRGLRCLRIIHGKGLGSPGGVGLLKQLSQGWLAQRDEILAFCQARPHDGGSGALLVLLRAGGGNRPS
ncbi:MAG: Smr/MutS family protein [Rhodocyclaceae bacterium]|nr:Smr/MutS family protein [Rhodocyclaceae bacterium]